jgi:hypothetical protein
MIEKSQPVNFWYGVVTVIDDDPEKLGRVRVRIFGKHHQDPNILKNEDLPLAQVLMPPIYASLSGVGKTPTGLLPGSWVIGFFLDPEIENMPIILGSVPSMQFPEDAQKEVEHDDKSGNQADLIFGINKDEASGWKNKSEKYGFCDPKEIYPTYTSQLPDGTKINASDVNSKIHASTEYNEHDYRKRKDTILSAVNAKTVKDPSFRFETNTIKEPFMAEPQYMHNHVYESESGHIKEFDDTPGKERIYEQHKSGTFQEIQHDGTKVTKVYGQDFELCLNGKQLIINSGESGTNGLNIIVNGDININSSGSVIERIYGNVTKIIHGSLAYYVKKGITFESFYGDILSIVHNEKRYIVKSNGPISLSSDAGVSVEASPTTNIKSHLVVSGNLVSGGSGSISGNLKIGGKSNSEGGAGSHGLTVQTNPSPHKVDSPDTSGSPGPSDGTKFPYNKGPLLCWSTKKSQSPSTASGWDYHKPDKANTTHRKHFRLNNFSPITTKKQNAFQGYDGDANSSTTNFMTFDAFSFTYQHDKKYEWYEKPYKNEKERKEGQLFRQQETTPPKSPYTFEQMSFS